jgi:hypothetical protein
LRWCQTQSVSARAALRAAAPRRHTAGDALARRVSTQTRTACTRTTVSAAAPLQSTPTLGPWCYIGKRRLEKALSTARAAHPGVGFEVRVARWGQGRPTWGVRAPRTPHRTTPAWGVRDALVRREQPTLPARVNTQLVSRRRRGGHTPRRPSCGGTGALAALPAQPHSASRGRQQDADV